MFKQILAILSITSLYFLLVSPPAEVMEYQNYQPPGDFDKYIKHTNRFYQMELISSPHFSIPEDIDIDLQTGDIYSGNLNGTLFRIKPDRTREEVLQSKGPIMRIELDKKNNHLYFMDVSRGVCKGDLQTKLIQTIVPFQPYGSINSFDIGKDGKIYISEVSSKFAGTQATLAMLSGRPDGNIYSYDPQTNQTKKLFTNLHCPNGVQVSPDGEYLYIAQMGRYRILRINLKTGARQSVIENLEAIPDNLRFNSKGELWIGLPLFRNSLQNFLIQNRWVREQLSKISLPILNKFAQSDYVGALKINTQGQVLDYIKQASEKYPGLSTAMQYNGRLYLGSFIGQSIGIVPIVPQQTNEKEEHQL